jgi:hypothetical protein
MTVVREYVKSGGGTCRGQLKCTWRVVKRWVHLMRYSRWKSKLSMLKGWKHTWWCWGRR